MTKMRDIYCSVYFTTEHPIEVFGEILSKVAFGGLPFQGREESICEEIPALYIKQSILGMSVVLIEQNQFGKLFFYELQCRVVLNGARDCLDFIDYKEERIDASPYIENLLRVLLKDDPNITVLYDGELDNQSNVEI